MDFANIQLNFGDVALPFQPRSFAEELALCQRYFEKSYNVDTSPRTVTSFGAFAFRTHSTSLNIFTIPFSVAKRVNPTVTFYSSVTGEAGKVRNITSNVDLDVSMGNNGIKQCTANIAATNPENVIVGHWTADAEL